MCENGLNSVLASATGLKGKREKEACYNLFSMRELSQNSGHSVMYVNEFTVYFTIIYPTFPRGQKQVVAGLPPFLSSRPAEEANRVCAERNACE